MTRDVPIEIQLAYTYGQKSMETHEKCYKHYPYCPYSARMMLKVLEIYSYLFDG